MTFTKPDPWIAKRGRTYLCQATGLSDKSVTELVEEGKLPGEIMKGFVVLTPGLFDQWWAGEWRSRPTPIDMHRTIRKEA